jgi:hypothetical protein
MKIGLSLRIGVATAAFALLLSSPALHASTIWNWTYSSNIYSGSGTFTTDSITTSVGGFTGYLIESATGTWNGLPVTLAPNAFGGNDDLLGASSPFLDDNGATFMTSADSFNIYYNGFGYQAYGAIGAPDNANGQFFARVTTPTPAAATPEPGSIALVLTGVVGGIGAIRRRVRA